MSMRQGPLDLAGLENLTYRRRVTDLSREAPSNVGGSRTTSSLMKGLMGGMRIKDVEDVILPKMKKMKKIFFSMREMAAHYVICTYST